MMAPKSTHTESVSLSRRRRLTLIRGIGELPVLPVVLAEVMTLDPSSIDYFERLVHLAEQDPPFAVRLLQFANSAASSPAVPVVKIRTAVARMGSRAAGEVVTALSVARVFVPTSDEQRGLWLHALQVAVGARTLCVSQGLSLQPEVAYLAGLLHDVGRFVMFMIAPAELHIVEEVGWSDGDTLVRLEHDLCGIDHADLGARALRRWGLPDLLVRLIAQHHLAIEQTDVDLREMLDVIQRADALSISMLEYPDADAQEIARRSARGGVSSGFAPLVDEIRAESLRLARQLGVAPRGEFV